MDDRKSMHDTPRLANTGQSGISDGRTEMGDCDIAARQNLSSLR